MESSDEMAKVMGFQGFGNKKAQTFDVEVGSFLSGDCMSDLEFAIAR